MIKQSVIAVEIVPVSSALSLDRSGSAPRLDENQLLKEVYMPTKVRVNLANRLELQELPGVGPREAEAIVKFRAEHGPIHDERQLASILGGQPTAESLSARADFSPADATAPEAPGA
jgi:competence ComEA-like helix-hairpin-helix protein